MGKGHQGPRLSLVGWELVVLVAAVWTGGSLFLEGRDSGPHLCSTLLQISTWWGNTHARVSYRNTSY